MKVKIKAIVKVKAVKKIVIMMSKTINTLFKESHINFVLSTCIWINVFVLVLIIPLF